jgi:peptide/nickel transport system permease protein
MLKYIIKRVLNMIPTLILISITAFIIIQLPPGDWLSDHISRLEAQGDVMSEDDVKALKEMYGLDLPPVLQYFKWIWNFIHGDMGYSYQYNMWVNKIIGKRLPLTILITFVTWIFTMAVSFPIAIYSATHQYSFGDYTFTFVGFIGLATPNFMLALLLMWFTFTVFGSSVGGLFSPGMIDQPWSLAKVGDLLMHLWVPILVVGTAGTAGLIRTTRANLLDELEKPYVDTARAKGMKEGKLIWKHPVRIALIPWVSTAGWMLPALISGTIITAVVLNLPTTGPILLNALKAQDMYLAGSFIMLVSVLTVIGTLISDILLALVDPRIRLE